MANTTISDTIITKGIAFRFTEAGAALSLTDTGSLTSTGASAIYSTRAANSVYLDGHVQSGSSSAIAMLGDHANVQIRAGAEVSSLISGFYGCLSLGGSDSSIFNAGSITAINGSAVTMTADRQFLTNSGEISGKTYGVYVGNQQSGIQNFGTISVSSSMYDAGAVVLYYDGAAIANYGTITSNGSDAAGVQVRGVAGGGANRLFQHVIENHGTIASTGGYGVVFEGSSMPWSGPEIVNTGVISGTRAALLCSDNADTIANSGTMIGDVILARGNDVFDGLGGTVQGRIFGGLGDDVFRVSDSAAQIVELAGQGRDVIEATVSFDLTDRLNIEKLVLLGADAIDATGNAQNDVILGNAGDNILSGAAGYDRLAGQAGNDVLVGDTGEDLLFGGAGRDTLLGGDGDDRLTGGVGADLLSGGAGADVFYFNAALDSRPHAGADVITDFTSGLDRINLAAIDADPQSPGDQALVFIGAAAFGHVAGEVRYAEGVLEIDLGGDGRADMVVILSGAPMLVANDLSL